MTREEKIKKIIDEGRVQLLFQVAEEVMGTQGLIDCTLPYWSEDDVEAIVRSTYKLMKSM